MSKLKKDFVDKLISGDELTFEELYNVYYRKCDYILRQKYGMYDRTSYNPDGTRHVYFEELRKEIIHETFRRVITHISKIGDTPIARFIFMHLRSARADILKKEVHLPDIDGMFKKRGILRRRITKLSKLASKYMSSNISKDKVISINLKKIISKFSDKLTDIESYIYDRLNQVKTAYGDISIVSAEHDIFQVEYRSMNDFIIRECIQKVLELMPEKDAGIVKSIYFYELTYKETAERFGCTIYRVRTAVSTFRKEVKKQLP